MSDCCCEKSCELGLTDDNALGTNQDAVVLAGIASQCRNPLFLARPVVDDASAHQEIVLMVVGGVGKSGEVVVDLNDPHRETGT